MRGGMRGLRGGGRGGGGRGRGRGAGVNGGGAQGTFDRQSHDASSEIEFLAVLLPFQV